MAKYIHLVALLAIHCFMAFFVEMREAGAGELHKVYQGEISVCATKQDMIDAVHGAWTQKLSENKCFEQHLRYTFNGIIGAEYTEDVVFLLSMQIKVKNRWYDVFAASTEAPVQSDDRSIPIVWREQYAQAS